MARRRIAAGGRGPLFTSRTHRETEKIPVSPVTRTLYSTRHAPTRTPFGVSAMAHLHTSHALTDARKRQIAAVRSEAVRHSPTTAQESPAWHLMNARSGHGTVRVLRRLLAAAERTHREKEGDNINRIFAWRAATAVEEVDTRVCVHERGFKEKAARGAYRGRRGRRSRSPRHAGPSPRCPGATAAGPAAAQWILQLPFLLIECARMRYSSAGWFSGGTVFMFFALYWYPRRSPYRAPG